MIVAELGVSSDTGPVVAADTKTRPPATRSFVFGEDEGLVVYGKPLDVGPPEPPDLAQRQAKARVAATLRKWAPVAVVGVVLVAGGVAIMRRRGRRS